MERIKKPNRTIRGIAFDLEGTIVDIEKLHHAAHLQSALDVGVNISLEEAIKVIPHMVGGPDAKVSIEIASLAKSNVSPQRILKAKQSYFKEYLQKHNNISPREGFVEFIGWIKKAGLKYAIGTVTNRKLARYLLKQANISSEFNKHIIVTNDDIERPKPFPDVYIETAHRLGLQTKKQLVIEDSIIGLKAAKSAGCRAIALPTIHAPTFIDSLIKNGAEKIFFSWNDPDLKNYIARHINTELE